MYCPECGNNIADESTKFCPVCGYELNSTPQSKFTLDSEQPNMNSQPAMNNQQPPNSGYGQSVYNPQSGGGYRQPVYNQQSGGGYQQPMYNQQVGGAYSQPPKQNTGLIIGVIIGAVVLIAAIVIFLIFFVFKKDDTDDTGKKDSAGTQTVQDVQNDPLPEDDIGTSEAGSDIALGTYSISSMRLEGETFDQSFLDSEGYGEMTLRVETDYIYFKQTADGYDVPYNYTGSGGTGKMWNSVEEYAIYYTDDTITIDFASSDDFSEYTEYTMNFTR